MYSNAKYSGDLFLKENGPLALSFLTPLDIPPDYFLKHKEARKQLLLPHLYLYFLQSIDILIQFIPDLINRCKTPFSNFFNEFKFFVKSLKEVIRTKKRNLLILQMMIC